MTMVGDSMVQRAQQDKQALQRNLRTRVLAKAGLLLSGLGMLLSASSDAAAQAPLVLPYTITSAAGLVGTTVCAGAFDAAGDGCPASQASLSADIRAVGVDPQGNLIIADTANSIIRRVNVRTGVITLVAGSLTAMKTYCAAAIDKYGDGCPASDGMANSAGGFTGNLSKPRGVFVARNGDIYIAGYSDSVVHKISASTGLMTLVAGSVSGATTGTKSGVKTYSGDGGPANVAGLNQPRGVAADDAGNVYIADTANNVVRKVTASTGIITTFAGVNPNTGNGSGAAVAGFAGDGNLATTAQLSGPEDIALDANGNVYIGDSGNQRVRVVYAGGKIPGVVGPQVGHIYTIAGGGTVAYVPNQAILATSINYVPTGTTGLYSFNPRKLAVDANGNLFIADSSSNVVWFLDARTDFMRVIGGEYPTIPAPQPVCSGATDTFGDGCPATQATFGIGSSGLGVAVDAQENVYVTDPLDSLVRKISTNQVFRPLAVKGTATQTLSLHYAPADPPAVTGPFAITAGTPFALSGTSSCVTNADTTTDCTQAVTFSPVDAGAESSTLTATTLASIGKYALTGVGIGAAVAFDPGTTSVLGAGLSAPQSARFDGARNSYIADKARNQVFLVAPGGATTVVAGTGTAGYTGDGAAATAATLRAPGRVIAAPNGDLYIADSGNNVVRRVSAASGTITTVAGGAAAVCAQALDAQGDGCPATQATFSAPNGLALDSFGALYIADSGNGTIRLLTPNGFVTRFAGAGTLCAATTADAVGDGCPALQSTFSTPGSLELDLNGNLLIAATGDNRIRRIDNVTGLVSSVAGTGIAGAAAGSGAANTAQLNAPQGVAVDASGNIYVADTGNHAIRMVASATGTIQTVMGSLGTSGTGTLGGAATQVQLNAPAGVALTSPGALLVADSGNSRLIAVNRNTSTFNFGRINVGAQSAVQTIFETSTGNAAAALGTPLTTSTGSTGVLTLTGSGSSGCTAGQTLALGAQCSFAAQFSPTASAVSTATYTESNAVVVNTPAPSVVLSGTGVVLVTTTTVTTQTTPVPPVNAQYGTTLVVSSTVTPSSCTPPASCVPTGSVTFIIDQSQQIVSQIAAGTTATASASISGLSVGTHSVVAIYGGDLNYASSTAPALTVTITKASTTIRLTSSAATSPQFTPITLSAAVASTTTGTPTGGVTFYNGATALGTAQLNGQGVATLVLNTASQPLPVGTLSLTAVYGSDSDFSTSTSAPFSETITALPPDFSVSIAAPASVTIAQGTSSNFTVGSTNSLKITISPTNTFTGTVSFSCSGLPAFSACNAFNSNYVGGISGGPTIGGSTLTFTAVQGVATPQTIYLEVTTDTTPGLTPYSRLNAPLQKHGQRIDFAMLGLPMLLLGGAGVFGLRRRGRRNPLAGALFALMLMGGSLTMLSGCSSGVKASGITPVGTSTVTLTATGSGGVTHSTTFTLNVTAGQAGAF